MTTLYIKDNTPEAKNFVKYAQTLPFVEKCDDEAFEPIQGLARTPRECLNAIDEALNDVREGRVYSSEEVFKPYEKWM